MTKTREGRHRLQLQHDQAQGKWSPRPDHDSGVNNNPYIITQHLSGAGTSSAFKEDVPLDILNAIGGAVRELMEEQHKEMLRNPHQRRVPTTTRVHARHHRSARLLATDWR